MKFKVGDFVEFIEEGDNWQWFRNCWLEVVLPYKEEFAVDDRIWALKAGTDDAIIADPSNFKLIFRGPRWEKEVS